MMIELSRACIDHTRSLREAMTRMDASGLGIVLVLDPAGCLVGTITDGDVRRAILASVNLEVPVTELLARKAGSRYEKPITAPAGADRADYVRLLKERKILHLPIVDATGRVVELVTLDEFFPDAVLPLHAIVMAGGAGTRLHPLTESTPKPMLPIGDQPLLEITIGRLREAGIKHVKITTHHKPEKIAAHFGDGSGFGVEMAYVSEDRPLGTVGGLGLLAIPTETTLVINGDILTQVDFRAMLNYHREHEADLTVAVRRQEQHVPYGIIESDGPMVRRLREKPSSTFFVNAGIYLLEPMVYHHIPAGQRFDMTDLIQRLLDHGRPVASFPVHEYWMDIGQHADYQLAQEHAKQWAAPAK